MCSCNMECTECNGKQHRKYKTYCDDFVCFFKLIFI